MFFLDKIHKQSKGQSKKSVASIEKPWHTIFNIQLFEGPGYFYYKALLPAEWMIFFKACTV